MIDVENRGGAAPESDTGASRELQAFIGRSQVLTGAVQLGELTVDAVVQQLVGCLPRLSSVGEFDLAKAILLRVAKPPSIRSVPATGSDAPGLPVGDQLQDLQQRALQPATPIPSTTSGRHEMRHTEAVRAIAAQLGDPHLRLSAIAAELKISVSHLRFLFRRYSGASFTTLLRRARIATACPLLRTTSDNIEQIAEKVGYRSTSRFDRDFKKETGSTPTQFRNRNSDDRGAQRS